VAISGIGVPPHRLDVLLRHRPRSISSLSAAFHAKRYSYGTSSTRRALGAGDPVNDRLRDPEEGAGEDPAEEEQRADRARDAEGVANHHRRSAEDCEQQQLHGAESTARGPRGSRSGTR
jgi:hypothetical protein